MKYLYLLIAIFFVSCSVETDYQTEPRPDYEWLWPENTIYYYFYDYTQYTSENNAPEYVKESVREATKIISNATNVNIIEVADKHEIPEGIDNYVIIYKGAFSSGTDRGMQPGINKMNIAFIDSPTDAIHEWGHELGLEHEQKMAYRNNNMIINFDNMIANDITERAFGISEYYFNKTEIDYLSVMLIDSFSYSKNGKPTSTKTDGSTFTKNETLSKLDIVTINYLYPNND